MILFDKLWQTMQERGITQYDLYTKYNMNRAQLHRLRHNQNIETNTLDRFNTLDRLCNILDCNIEDIMTHIKDDNNSF